jgi:eukaryotic-like serine/threonine-protein kinase
VVQTIARESGGNPFFVSELVRALEEGAADEPESGPVALEAVIRRRIERLPQPARLVLELIAVGDGPTALGILRRAAGIDREFDTAASILRTARLVRAGGGRESDDIEAYHSRIREAVLAGLDGASLADRHRRLGDAFITAGEADPVRLVVHFQGAGDFGQAVRYAVAAARRAERALAFNRAAELYRLALTLQAEAGDPSARDADALRVSLADALVYAGRGAEAAREYLQAAAQAPEAERLEHTRRAADQYLRSGHVDEAVVLLARVLEHHGVSLPETPRRALPGLLMRRARIRTRGLGFTPRPAASVPDRDLVRVDLTWSVANVMGFVDTIRGADFQARHLLAALEVGEPMRVARALATEAAYAAAGGPRGRRRARQILDRARAAVGSGGEPYIEGQLRLAGALVSFFGERWRDARAEMDDAATWFRERCRGVIWEINSARGFSLWCASYLGELAELRERAQEYLDDARERGDRYAIASLSAAVPNLAWLVDDRPDEARAVVAEAMEQWSVRGFHVQHYYELIALTNADLYQGRGRAAWERLEQRWPALRRSLLLRIPQIRTELGWCRARAALAAGLEAPEILAAAESAARDLAGAGPVRAPHLAAMVRAGVLAARGRTEHAAATYMQAAIGFDALEMPVWSAAARRRRAALAGDHGAVADLDRKLAERGARCPGRFYGILAPAIA